jgi:hypothetical protein
MFCVPEQRISTVRPVPEPCCYRARSTSGKSAIACRTESRSDLQKRGALDKFLAPVTVPKTLSTAFIELLRTYRDEIDL